MLEEIGFGEGQRVAHAVFGGVLDDRLLAKGREPHVIDEAKAVTQIGEGLNVGAA